MKDAATGLTLLARAKRLSPDFKIFEIGVRDHGDCGCFDFPYRRKKKNGRQLYVSRIEVIEDSRLTSLVRGIDLSTLHNFTNSTASAIISDVGGCTENILRIDATAQIYGYPRCNEQARGISSGRNQGVDEGSALARRAPTRSYFPDAFEVRILLVQFFEPPWCFDIREHD